VLPRLLLLLLLLLFFPFLSCKVYLFGVLGALCNAVSSIDLKGWALLYTLPEQQFVLELAGGLMHFGLFILMTTWISIAQVSSEEQ
jgi:hypothetical protein